MSPSTSAGCSPAPSPSPCWAGTMADPGTEPRPGSAAAAADSLEGIANLDFARADRRGYPEAVFCQGKSVDQVAAIAAAVAARPDQVTLFTRASEEQAKAVLNVLPDAHWDRV